MKLKNFLVFLAIFPILSCAPRGTENPVATPEREVPTIETVVQTEEPKIDEWWLWVNGTQLRGANIYQRPVMPDYDGPIFFGTDTIGPPYVQEDFDRLAALGANYVNISHPGLFTINPPYGVNEQAVANLDRLLDMIAKADMFAVITFHSGPGRSVFSILRSRAGISFDKDYVVENIWEDPVAQAAWAEMWRYTAERYKDNPIVVGYDLMCEPNTNSIVGTWDQDRFYADYGGTGYDWNSWVPSIVKAVREVDSQTPILVSPIGYGAIYWLPYVQIVDDPRIVYAFHQYSPQNYTHQVATDQFVFPGYLDTNSDGLPENFDQAWLEDLLKIAGDFEASKNVQLSITEYGAMRWAPGAEVFIDSETELFEQYGWNYAIWMWYPSWKPFVEGEKTFNFRLGPMIDSERDTSNPLFSTIVGFWERNTIRPSSMP